MTPRRSFADLVESFAASLRVNKAKPIGLKLRRDGPSGGALEWLATCKICGTDLRTSGRYLREAKDKCLIDGCNTRFRAR